MKALLVEDDKRTASFIKKGLKQESFVVEHAENGKDGLYFALGETYDVAIIDIMLPQLDGLTLIETMRKNKISTPVLVLSAKRSVDDRVLGLQRGGDDYLIKPFSFSELVARLHALVRRHTSMAEPMKLSAGDLTLDILARKVTRQDQEIELQPREFSLLEYLLRNAGRVVSKTMIQEHVWDYNFDPHTNVVETRVCRLRDKVDRPFNQKLIHTIRGVGYVLEEKK